MLGDSSMKPVVAGQLATNPTGQPLQLTTLQKVAVQNPGIRPISGMSLYRPQAQLGQGMHGFVSYIKILFTKVAISCSIFKLIGC